MEGCDTGRALVAFRSAKVALLSRSERRLWATSARRAQLFKGFVVERANSFRKQAFSQLGIKWRGVFTDFKNFGVFHLSASPLAIPRHQLVAITIGLRTKTAKI